MVLSVVMSVLRIAMINREKRELYVGHKGVGTEG